MEDINIPLLQGNLEDIIQEQSVNNSDEQGRDSTVNTQEIYDQEARSILKYFKQYEKYLLFYFLSAILYFLFIELLLIILHYRIILKI